MRQFITASFICLPFMATAGEVTVFAASSLVDAMTELADLWEEETGHDMRLSFGGSSTLATQIALGAPADIFVSADPDWMDHVDSRIADRIDLLGNTLVLIASGVGEDQGASVTSSSFADLGRGPLAMALVDAVPAGRYGRAALENLGLWSGLPVAEVANVRAALALVASGAAPLGVVYGSDAASTDAVHVRATFPEGSHPEIIYPAARLTGGAGDPDAVADFMVALQSPEAKDIFLSHGFLPR